MPKIDISKFATQAQSDLTTSIAASFAKTTSGSSLKGAALSTALSAGEALGAAFIKNLGEGAQKSFTTKMASNSAMGRLGETLIDSLVDQITKAATSRLKAATSGANQNLANAFGVPVRGAAPVVPATAASYFDASGRLAPGSKMYNPAGPGSFDRRWQPAGQIFSTLPDQPALAPLPPAQTWYQNLLGAGSAWGSSRFATGAALYSSERVVSGLLGSAGSGMQQTLQVNATLARLQKTMRDSSSSARSFHDNIAGAGWDLGTLPVDAAAVASSYFPSARMGSGRDVSQIMHFATGYGLSSDSWASQMAGAAGLGLVGGAQGSMGTGPYQAMLAQSFAGTSGIAKMGDYTTGWQDLSRIIQANTATTQNPNNSLQLYTALNKSGVAGLSGTSGAALLGQLNQGIVNAPNAASPVQMAYYQALGSSKGISPSQLAYQTEQGLSGDAFKKVLAYSKKAYADFNASDKLYAQSKLFGLDMHQTQAVIKAYGSGNNGFSMQGLYGLIGGKQNLGQVNDSQLNLLTQLASGKSTSTVAREMAQQNVTGAGAFFRHGAFTGASAQTLANTIMRGGTPQGTDVQTTGAINAAQRQVQQVTDAFGGLYTEIKLATGAFGALAPFLVGLGLKPGVKAVRHLLTNAAERGAAGAAADAAGGAAAGGLAARMAGRLGGATRILGGGAAAAGTEEFLFGQASGGMGQYARNHKGWNVSNAGGVLGYLEGGSIAYNHRGGPNFGDWLNTHWGLNPAVGAAGPWQAAINPVQSIASAGTGVWDFIFGQHASTGGSGSPNRGMPRGARGGGVLTQTAAEHQRALGLIFSQHLKASSLQTEQTVGSSLNIHAPLLPKTLRDLQNESHKFQTAFGTQLTAWMAAALGSAGSTFSGLPTSGSTSGGTPMGSTGSLVSPFRPGGPTNSNWLGKLFGASSISQGYHQNNEQGVDVNMSAGAAVKMASAGKFVSRYSTPYQSVFDVGGGLYESYTHLDAIKGLKNGMRYAAGTQIGSIDPRSGTYSARNGNGDLMTYHSGGPHLEFGVYNSAANAGAYKQGLDPTPYLAQAAAYDPNAGLAMGGSGMPSWLSVTRGGKQQFLRSPQYIRDYVNASKKYGVPLAALVAQGYQESGWQAGAVNPTNVPGYGHAKGIAQFMQSTANGFGINPFNPDQSIDAQGKYMARLMKSNGGLKGAWNAYGTGDITSLMNSVQMGGGATGGGTMTGRGGSGLQIHIDPLQIDIRHPDGSTQKIVVQPRARFGGIPFTHDGHAAPSMGGRAPRR